MLCRPFPSINARARPLEPFPTKAARPGLFRPRAPPGRWPRRDVLQERGQSQRPRAPPANAVSGARLVVAAFENLVEFVGADAALVQQRDGGRPDLAKRSGGVHAPAT